MLYRITWDMAEETGLPHHYSAEFIFAHQFTLHYDEFAQYLPEFGRLKELSKLSVLIRFFNGVRHSNEDQLDALNYLLNEGSRGAPPRTEVYEKYKKSHEQICAQVETVFEELSGQVSSAVLGRKWHQELTRIKRDIGTLEFHRHSPEVNEACEELLAQTSRINPGVPSWRISNEAVEPKRGEIAQQLSQMKQESCRAQLSQAFSSRLSSSNRQHCINAFIQGNITPLTEALVAHERSQAQQQLRPQFSKGSTRDIHLALEGNRPAMVRVAKAQSQHQLSQQKQAKQRLESGFSEIGLGRDSKSSPMKGRCFWVPASVRHEVKKNDGGALTRHSFFVYGGVRVQPRINVIRASAPPRGVAVRAAGARSGGGGNHSGGGGNRSGGGNNFFRGGNGNKPQGGVVSVNPAKIPTKSGVLTQAKLPNRGKIRFVPDKKWHPTVPLPKGNNGGFIDRFGNEWVKGSSRTSGQAKEWDVQLSRTGKKQLGWASRDGRHLNVSLDGHITHR